MMPDYPILLSKGLVICGRIRVAGGMSKRKAGKSSQQVSRVGESEEVTDFSTRSNHELLRPADNSLLKTPSMVSQLTFRVLSVMLISDNMLEKIYQSRANTLRLKFRPLRSIQEIFSVWDAQAGME
jgi:hypothetical protein